MKSSLFFKSVKLHRVAPFTGAWIEINSLVFPTPISAVAPFTGAWIEIYRVQLAGLGIGSHPSRVHGLKF